MTSLFLALLGVQTAHAGSIAPVGSAPSSNENVSATGIIEGLANNVIIILFLIGGVAAVFYIIWAGIQYINSGGSADKAKTARAVVINVLIGIILMMAAFVIIRFAYALGTSLLRGVQ